MLWYNIKFRMLWYYDVMMLCFFCWFALFFIYFFSRVVSRLICTKLGTNVSSCMQLLLNQAFDQKFKNQVTPAKKHRKIGQIFAPTVTFSLIVTKRLKFFEKSFLRWHLGFYTFQKISLRQFRTVWFSQSLGSMERQKRPTLRAIISQTVRDTAKVCMECQ